MLKVCVFLADGFEEIEGLTVVDLLRRAGIETTMVSISENIVVSGTHGIRVEADRLFGEVDYKDIDMLVLPGGMPGTKKLGNNKELGMLIKEFNEKGKWIGAICAAPSILGEMGILRKRKAVCYPGFEEKLAGADYVDEKVVLDGNIITSKAMGTAISFSGKIIEVLCGKEKADNILDSIMYKD